jgi:hypothetical protein
MASPNDILSELSENLLLDLNTFLKEYSFKKTFFAEQFVLNWRNDQVSRLTPKIKKVLHTIGIRMDVINSQMFHLQDVYHNYHIISLPDDMLIYSRQYSQENIEYMKILYKILVKCYYIYIDICIRFSTNGI